MGEPERKPGDQETEDGAHSGPAAPESAVEWRAAGEGGGALAEGEKPDGEVATE